MANTKKQNPLSSAQPPQNPKATHSHKKSKYYGWEPRIVLDKKNNVVFSDTKISIGIKMTMFYIVKEIKKQLKNMRQE